MQQEVGESILINVSFIAEHYGHNIDITCLPHYCTDCEEYADDE